MGIDTIKCFRIFNTVCSLQYELFVHIGILWMQIYAWKTRIRSIHGSIHAVLTYVVYLFPFIYRFRTIISTVQCTTTPSQEKRTQLGGGYITHIIWNKPLFNTLSDKRPTESAWESYQQKCKSGPPGTSFFRVLKFCVSTRRSFGAWQVKNHL